VPARLGIIVHSHPSAQGVRPSHLVPDRIDSNVRSLFSNRCPLGPLELSPRPSFSLCVQWRPRGLSAMLRPANASILASVRTALPRSAPLRGRTTAPRPCHRRGANPPTPCDSAKAPASTFAIGARRRRTRPSARPYRSAVPSTRRSGSLVSLLLLFSSPIAARALTPTSAPTAAPARTRPAPYRRLHLLSAAPRPIRRPLAAFVLERGRSIDGRGGPLPLPR
jgi:hypothetical protein